MKNHDVTGANCRAIVLTIGTMLLAMYVAGISAFASPNGINSSPLIDETMPDTIPSEIIMDWILQDSVGSDFAATIQKIKSGLPDSYAARIADGSTAEAYLAACHVRRAARMQPYADCIRKIIYARHHDIGGSVYGYIEDLNPDGSRGLGQWGMAAMSKSTDYAKGNTDGTAIHMLEFTNCYPQPTDIITDSKGCLRDPCVSYDGKRIVFAWSKDNNGYHIYELNIDNPTAIRQLTDDPSGTNVSDCQPCVLPSGDIIFNSSRCYGFLPHSLNLSSNLFIMNKDGKYLRRIGYDQAHTFYPTVMEDGRIMYCRIEFNDRNVMNCSGIFTMHPDGSHQAGFFGTQTQWSPMFLQSFQIRGGNKIMAIIGGHMGPFAGDLTIIDPSIGRDGSAAVQLIAPRRTISSSTAMSAEGVPDRDKLFQNPVPLDEEWFLISYRKTRSSKFQLYLMNTAGERELLAWGGTQSVSQPQLFMPRNSPLVAIPYQADYSKTTGELHVANVYTGSGIDTLALKGAIDKLRVVALEYSTDPAFGNTGSTGFQMNPVGRFGCTVNAKLIVGEAKVESDGSAAFIVPARTPVYFQLIDTLGCMVQTMRSWVTLQPGEKYECQGCHVDEATAPATASAQIAQTARPLDPFFEIADNYLHYPEKIQPILNAKCAGCHDASHTAGLDLRDTLLWTNDQMNNSENKNAFRFWCRSYLNLSASKYVNWNGMFSAASGIKPYSMGSFKSPLITMLREGHNDVALTREEIARLCAWIDLGIPHSGKNSDDMLPADSLNYEKRLDRRRQHEQIEMENIAGFIADGGYKAPGYIKTSMAVAGHGNIPAADMNAISMNGDRFIAVYSSINKRLSVFLPSEGVITLVNLSGRQVAKKVVGQQHFRKNIRMNIPATFPPGVYIVRFRGLAGLMERKVIMF